MVHYFSFPEARKRHSKKRSYPLETPEGRLTFAFIEVGCKHKKKQSQLKNKKELFLKYWGDTYRRRQDIDWIPRIYRIMSHYNKVDTIPNDSRAYSVDAIVHHKYITPEQLSGLGEREIMGIKNTVRKKDEQELLEKIIEESDADRLHTLILERQKDNKYSTLRGKMAEVLTQQAIYEVAAEAIQNGQIVNYRNGHIKYFNKRFDNGAEVDQILQFYGDTPYENMVFELSKKDNLQVVLDTQPLT